MDGNDQSHHGLSASIELARSHVRAAKRILVITGAGASADSGVPTFRGERRWEGVEVTKLASRKSFEEDPMKLWRWYTYRRTQLSVCRPNQGHVALAELERRRSDLLVFTQNVDDFHEQAGSTSVAHIHGTIWANRCTNCWKTRESRELEYARPPHSPCCDALERPDVVWFGEGYDSALFDQGAQAAKSSDLILVVGTSATVGITETLINYALQGAVEEKRPEPILIEINPAPALFLRRATYAEIEPTVRLALSSAQTLPQLVL